MNASDRVQTVRNAWINRVRDEALRMRRPEVSKAVGVGVWIATYADADGSNAYPSGATLAAIAGCTDETVTRCVRLLIAVGLLKRTRRPNKSAVYQLVIPLQRPDWHAHMHVWGESRQARARRRKKEQEMAELLARNPSADGNRNPSADGERNVPEPVPGGFPEGVRGRVPPPSGTRPRTGAEPVPGRVPEPVPGGGDQYLPTSGRDPCSDQDVSGSPTQPDTGADAREKNGQPPGEDSTAATVPADVARCTACGGPLVPDPRRPGRDRHTHCTPAEGDDAA